MHAQLPGGAGVDARDEGRDQALEDLGAETPADERGNALLSRPAPGPDISIIYGLVQE